MNSAESTRQRPSVTVAAVIERHGRFLIVKEPRDQKIVLNQPAGHVESDETLLEAVVREVKEETAWDFTPEFITGFYQWKNQSSSKTYFRATFTGSVSNHDPDQTLYDGIISAEWKTVSELNASGVILRSPMVLQCIEDYLAGTRFPLTALKSF